MVSSISIFSSLQTGGFLLHFYLKVVTPPLFLDSVQDGVSGGARLLVLDLTVDGSFFAAVHGMQIRSAISRMKLIIQLKSLYCTYSSIQVNSGYGLVDTFVAEVLSNRHTFKTTNDQNVSGKLPLFKNGNKSISSNSYA